MIFGTFILAVSMLLIGCSAPSATPTVGCTDMINVQNQIRTTTGLMNQYGTMMSNPNCATIDQAIQASAQLKIDSVWFSEHLCIANCNENMPNKQSVCGNVNVASVEARHNTLLAFKQTC